MIAAASQKAGMIWRLMESSALGLEERVALLVDAYLDRGDCSGGNLLPGWFGDFDFHPRAG